MSHNLERYRSFIACMRALILYIGRMRQVGLLLLASMVVDGGFMLYRYKGSYQIFQSVHNYGRQFQNHNITSKFLTEKYLEKIRLYVKWSVKSFKEHVRRDVKVYILMAQYYMAKSKVLEMVQGSHREQYAHLQEYCQTIRQTSARSTILIDVRKSNEANHPIFRRLYYYLVTCKYSFNNDCKPKIGLDRCHLKAHLGVSSWLQ